MDADVYKEIPRTSITQCTTQNITPVSSATGHGFDTVARITVTMYIDHTQVKATFVVVKNFKRRILIGSDFIYAHKIQLDFTGNTMKLNNDIILLTPKYESKHYTLLRVAAHTRIQPYTTHHISLTASRTCGTCIISPLDNSTVFQDKPGFTAPSIIAQAKHNQQLMLPLVNMSGCSHFVRKGTVIALAESIDNGPRELLAVDSSGQHLAPASNAVPLSQTDLHIGDSISPAHAREVEQLINKNKDIFASCASDLKPTNLTEATLDTGDHDPIRQRPYRNPLALRYQLDAEIDDMLKAGVISPSQSPWSSPVVIVPKRDGSKRICIDYRAVNRVLVKNSYPLPRIDDLFAMLGKAKYFTSLDFKSGYWQIAVRPEDRAKTAFTCHRGLFEFNRMPFGISSAPGIYQAMMAKCLAGIEGVYAVAYLDDILIFSSTYTDHLGHIQEVFKRIRKANLRLNLKKCHFMKPELEYLGHVISENGIRPNPDKVQAIKGLLAPTCVKDVRSFLGMAGYFRTFIPQFSAIARPLTQLTRKNMHFNWSDEEQQAFEILKQRLIEAPILAFPDPSKPYSLYTDASDYAVGGILTQDFPEGERVISYVSHQLAANRQVYPTIEKECFAIIYCITKLKQYILGADITVFTDHKPLKSLFTAEMKNTRVQRWAILLDEYKIKIEYRKGIHNGRADMLSRIQKHRAEFESEEMDDILELQAPNTIPKAQPVIEPESTSRTEADPEELQHVLELHTPNTIPKTQSVVEAEPISRTEADSEELHNVPEPQSVIAPEPISESSTQYRFFFKKSDFMSQWHPIHFIVDGMTYNCCEQFMMAQKALLFHDYYIYQLIMEATLPQEQKKLGRYIAAFDDTTWDEHKMNIVKTANKAKFTQNPELLEQLRATGDDVLAEANPYDTIWGIGLKMNDPNAQDETAWPGQNLLGNILMQIRTELQRPSEILEVTSPVTITSEEYPDRLVYNAIDFNNDVDLVKLQSEDADLKQIYESLRSAPTATMSKEYVIHDSLLYHLARPVRSDTEPHLQLVIPKSLTAVVIHGYHSDISGGHLGLEKTYAKIRSRYYWANSYKETADFVLKCDTCNRRMLRKRQAELQDNIQPTYPFECIGIDTVGPYPMSKQGNCYLITIVDWFSSWIEAFPVPNKEAKTIARIILEQFIPRHACPKYMVSDRGSEYVNSAIDLLSTEMRIKRQTTTPYHPQANGKTERSHRVLNDIIAKGLQGKSHDDWEDVLPQALFAMRNGISESTGHSSFFLVYGRDPVTPLDSLLKPRMRYYGDDYVPTALQRLHCAFSHVAANTKEARERNKRYAARHARQVTFKVGDAVYFHNPVLPAGQARKFHSPWDPYYRIVEMYSPVTAHIRSQYTGTAKVVHVNNLRLAYIDGGWDVEEGDEPRRFPTQNKRKLLEEPSRFQPVRQAKLAPNTTAYHEDTRHVYDDDEPIAGPSQLPTIPTAPEPEPEPEPEPDSGDPPTGRYFLRPRRTLQTPQYTFTRTGSKRKKTPDDPSNLPDPKVLHRAASKRSLSDSNDNEDETQPKSAHTQVPKRPSDNPKQQPDVKMLRREAVKRSADSDLGEEIEPKRMGNDPTATATAAPLPGNVPTSTALQAPPIATTSASTPDTSASPEMDGVNACEYNDRMSRDGIDSSEDEMSQNEIDFIAAQVLCDKTDVLENTRHKKSWNPLRMMSHMLRKIRNH